MFFNTNTIRLNHIFYIIILHTLWLFHFLALHFADLRPVNKSSKVWGLGSRNVKWSVSLRGVRWNSISYVIRCNFEVVNEVRCMSQPLQAIMSATPPSLSISPVCYAHTSHVLSLPAEYPCPCQCSLVWNIWHIFDTHILYLPVSLSCKLYLFAFTFSVKVDVCKTGHSD